MPAQNHYYIPYPTQTVPVPTVPPSTFLELVCYGIFATLNQLQEPGSDLLWCVIPGSSDINEWVILGNETEEATYEDRPESPYYEKIIRYRRENVAKGIIALAKGNTKMVKEFIKYAKFQIIVPHSGTGGSIVGPVMIPQGIQLPQSGWLSTIPDIEE